MEGDWHTGAFVGSQKQVYTIANATQAQAQEKQQFSLWPFACLRHPLCPALCRTVL